MELWLLLQTITTLLMMTLFSVITPRLCPAVTLPSTIHTQYKSDHKYTHTHTQPHTHTHTQTNTHTHTNTEIHSCYLHMVLHFSNTNVLHTQTGWHMHKRCTHKYGHEYKEMRFHISPEGQIVDAEAITCKYVHTHT